MCHKDVIAVYMGLLPYESLLFFFFTFDGQRNLLSIESYASRPTNVICDAYFPLFTYVCLYDFFFLVKRKW